MNRIFILIIACLLFFSCSEALDEALQEEINEMNANAPVQIDEITFFNSAYMNGDNIIFKYSVDTDGYDEIFKTADFQTLQKGILLDIYCHDPDLELFRDYNKSITYSYYSNSGAFLIEIMLFPSDCYN